MLILNILKEIYSLPIVYTNYKIRYIDISILKVLIFKWIFSTKTMFELFWIWRDICPLPVVSHDCQILLLVRMAVVEGPLSKWTNVMKGWQYRWFVLDEAAGLLSYFTVSFVNRNIVFFPRNTFLSHFFYHKGIIYFFK